MKCSICTSVVQSDTYIIHHDKPWCMSCWKWYHGEENKK